MGLIEVLLVLPSFSYVSFLFLRALCTAVGRLGKSAHVVDRKFAFVAASFVAASFSDQSRLLGLGRHLVCPSLFYFGYWLLLRALGTHFGSL